MCNFLPANPALGAVQRCAGGCTPVAGTSRRARRCAPHGCHTPPGRLPHGTRSFPERRGPRSRAARAPICSPHPPQGRRCLRVAATPGGPGLTAAHAAPARAWPPDGHPPRAGRRESMDAMGTEWAPRGPSGHNELDPHRTGPGRPRLRTQLSSPSPHGGRSPCARSGAKGTKWDTRQESGSDASGPREWRARPRSATRSARARRAARPAGAG
jgi:hypothetical protein